MNFSTLADDEDADEDEDDEKVIPKTASSGRGQKKLLTQCVYLRYLRKIRSKSLVTFTHLE